METVILSNTKKRPRDKGPVAVISNMYCVSASIEHATIHWLKTKNGHRINPSVAVLLKTIVQEEEHRCYKSCVSLVSANNAAQQKKPIQEMPGMAQFIAESNSVAVASRRN